MKNRLISSSGIVLSCAGAIALSLFVCPLSGATLSWDANAATAGQTDGPGVWLGASQWWNGSTNTSWNSSDDAVFGNGGVGGAVTLASPTAVGSLTFNYFTGTYTVGTAAQTITLGSGGINKNAGQGVATIISPVTLSAAQTLTNTSFDPLATGATNTLNVIGGVDNGGFTLTINGTGTTNFGGTANFITGTGGLTKNGTGVLVLSAASTAPAHNYSGTTTINGGVVRIQSGNNSTGTGNLTINNGVLEGYFTNSAPLNFTRTLGSAAAQVQILGGVSGFSEQGASMTVTLNNNAAFEVVWGAANEASNVLSTGFFNPSTFVLQGDTVNAGKTITFANKLDLNGTTRSIYVGQGSTTAATISGVIRNSNSSGTAGLTKTGPGNLTLSAADTYNGATTINGGLLTLSGSGTLASTSGLTLGGGTLRIINTAQVNRVADGAAITSNGGTISYENTSSANVYTETLGAVTHSAGQLNIVETANQAGAGSQTLTLGGLSRTEPSTVTFSATTTGPQAGGSKNMIVVTGAGTTTADQIIGPWATTGTTAAAQTNYAVYNSDYVVPAAIGGSLEGTWSTTHAATSNYTMANAGGTATTLTATRNVNSIRNTSTAASLTSVDPATDTITVTGHTFANGDVVTFGGTAPAGLTTGEVYYVRDVGVNTFKVSTTSVGTAVDITGAGASPNVTGGISLSTGNNLGTLGILNAAGSGLAIGRSGTGVITLPTTSTGNLYVTPGNGAVITIGAPIADNTVTGVLSLVKSGSATLRLHSANTYTGNTIINAGTLQIGTNGVANGANLGSGDYAGNIFIGAGANLDFQTNSNQTLSGIISGDGNLLKRYIGTLTPSGANTYTGKTTLGAITNAGDMTLVVSSFNSVNGGSPLLASSSLGAPTTIANGTIDIGSNNSSPNPTLRYTGAAATGETTDRVINFIFNSTATRTLDASNPSGLLKFSSAFTSNGTASGSLVLTGSGNAEIAPGLPFAFTNFTKSGSGTWTLGGSMGNTGTTTVSAGTLIINGNQPSATGALAVNGTSTLGGAGTISGAVTVAAGANLAPGAAAAAGTLTLKSGLNITAPASGGAGKLRFDLGPVAASDKLAVIGALTIGTDKLGFSDFVFTPLSGLTNGTYQLITGGSITAGNTLDPANLSGPIGVGTGTLQITGSNIELVVAGQGGLAGYGLWASTNASSTTPEQDQDGDGVSNAVEYVLGGTVLTNDQAKLPTISLSDGNLLFTFQRAQASIDGSTTVVIEVGTDLLTWPSPSPYAVPNLAAANNPGVTVVKNSSPGFDTITLTLPQGLDSRKFARLKVTVTPAP